MKNKPTYVDKYLVIWWNKDEEKVHVSSPVDYESAMGMVLAMDKGKAFFREDIFGELDNGEIYKDWSKVITKYQPILEKDLWDEL